MQVNYISHKDYANNHTLASKIRYELENTGYVVVQEFDIDSDDIESSGSKFLDIASLIGLPISHDANNSIIWDIKSNPDSVSNIKTYSEHNHEAELHTDSQYSEYPEDYFGLLTLKTATCGGGKSMLLSLKDILNELQSLPNGHELEHTLSKTDFPFVVPNVFKKIASNENEYNFGPILRPNEIRFRVDTCEKAIKANPEFCKEDQKLAFEELKKLILNSPSTMEFYLKEKDLIFINNKTMLHGRTSFTDARRHLLRIRMNKN